MKTNELKDKFINWMLNANINYTIEKNMFNLGQTIRFEKEQVIYFFDNFFDENFSDIEKIITEANNAENDINFINKEKASIENTKELLKIEKESYINSCRMRYKISIDDIKNSLKLEDNEKTKQLWQALLEIENLKSQIAFYKEQNEDYKWIMYRYLEWNYSFRHDEKEREYLY